VSEHLDHFSPMPARLFGEREERIAMSERALRYHVSFLDDCLRGILPHDLVLIGAPSGMGKTDLALGIAASNAMHKKRVAYFALEAEPRELERRTKFALLSQYAYRDRHPQASEMNYADWLLGNCEHICQDRNAEADQRILADLSGLQTFYRGAKFDQHDLQAAIQRVHTYTDLIVIDHLHYIDSDDENGDGLGDTVKTIRDVSLRIGRPIVLIAHLRKRDTRGKQIVASLDDFHGSSNIVKICTQAITIERAHCIEPAKWYLAPTFISVQKDRRAGTPGLVALAQFDKRLKNYQSKYSLGRLVKGGTEWDPLGVMDRPAWAKHCVPMEAS
jgi:hypothetical protein